MKKAFDRVPRKVLWWVLRSVGVEEWAIRVIQGIYANGCSRVRVNGSYSSSFQVGDGVHQGLVLSPLLFILVLEALSREFHSGVPWKMVDANKLSRPAVVWRGVNSESCYPYLPLNICH